MPKKVLEGIVTSNKMMKTLVVSSPRRYKDARIGKTLTTHKKYKLHCEAEGINVGDRVEFVECRPYSKEKKWRYLRTIKKAPETFEIKED